MKADPPQNQPARLAALRALGILDTPRDPRFDEIVELAAVLCETPIAVINLIDEGRQWFKAEVGLGVRETPLESSICAHVILRPGLTIIPDTLADPRFADNPLCIGGPGLRFYAGAVMESDGQPVGTLCVLDTRPRDLSPMQRQALLVLGRQVVTRMEHARELARLEQMMRDQQATDAHYRAIVTDSADAIMSIGPDGIIATWNQGAVRMFGWKAAEVVGRKLHELIIPADKFGEFATSTRALREGRPVRLDTVRSHRSGRLIDVSISLTPLLENGVLAAISGIIRDISEQKRAEAKIRFLMDEVTHRAKNLLALVQSVARQTGRGAQSVPAFSERFESRLQALAASVDLVAAENWEGALLDDLVRSQLAVFGDIDGVRLKIEGPARRLRPQAAQAIGLALHELATNAVKYGALSVPEGRVEIDWSVDASNPDDSRFTMHWRECNGPSVVAPAHRGFGRTVIERMVAQALEGKVTLEFAPDGVRWRLDSRADVTLPG